MPGDPHLRPLLTLAFAASLLFAVLAAGYALPDLAGHPSHRLVLDAARHAFALGFVTVTIFAMAGRILPRFAAVELRWPRLRWSGALLVAVGLVLREAQVLVALFATPTLLPVSAVSGVVAATGVVLAATSILGTLATARRARAAALSVPAATAPRGRSLPLTSGASS